MDNFITACEPCNLGKSANLLADIPKSLKDKAEELKERELQIKGYQSVMDQKRSRIDSDAEHVRDVYELFNPTQTLTDSAMVSVRKFIDSLGKHEVVNAMEKAFSRPSNGPGSLFKYFCGICWTKIKEGK